MQEGARTCPNLYLFWFDSGNVLVCLQGSLNYRFNEINELMQQTKFEYIHL